MSNPYSPPDQQEPAGQPASLARQARGFQIITFAMAMGVLVFMGMCLVMNEGVLGEKPELLSWIGIGFAAITFVRYSPGASGDCGERNVEKTFRRQRSLSG